MVLGFTRAAAGYQEESLIAEGWRSSLGLKKGQALFGVFDLREYGVGISPKAEEFLVIFDSFQSNPVTWLG